MSQDRKLPNSNEGPLYEALGESGEFMPASVNPYDLVKMHKTYGASTSYDGLETRSPFTRTQYDEQRPAEGLPKQWYDIFDQCDDAYYNAGQIRNIIDLMADFACQGVRISHPNPRVEQFYKSWWKKVRGSYNSERFCNYLFRLGNTVVYSSNKKITKKETKVMHRASGKEVTLHDTEVKNKTIPLRYTFLNPKNVIPTENELTPFLTRPTYAITLPSSIEARTDRRPCVNFPDEIQQALNEGKDRAELDPDKTFVYHYKKDDWNVWAKPIIFSALHDTKLLLKMKMADAAALDGALSRVRIFTIGDIENKIRPTEAAFAKLSQALSMGVGGGTMDLIWGEDLKLQESDTTVHKFLGIEKYEPVLTFIYATLGVPQTLTGSATGGTGTTNNLISLRTLLERLDYARDILIEFWEEQIAIVQKAMGFRIPAKLEFDFNSFGDEAAILSLLVQLNDRNIISDEALQVAVKKNPELERARMMRESRERYNGKRPAKLTPFSGSDLAANLKKIGYQSGTLTSTEVGLMEDAKRKEYRLEEDDERDKHLEEMNGPSNPGGGNPSNDGNKGVPQQGRPQNSKDTVDRKEKDFKPKTKAAVEIWANSAQDAIAKILNVKYLEQKEKNNLRKLTATESLELELAKFGVLCNIDPFTDITEDLVLSTDMEIPNHIATIYTDWTNSLVGHFGRSLSLPEMKNLQASIYSEFFEENNG